MARRTPSGPVARGPVPRERTRAPETVVRDRLIPNGTWRGESLTWPVARGPVPRERTREKISSGPKGPRERAVGQECPRLIHSGAGAPELQMSAGRAITGDRPPRYGTNNGPFHRRARACPSPCNDRGGQAPALRARTKKARGTSPRATYNSASLLPLLDFAKRCQRTIRWRNGTWQTTRS